MAIAVEGTLVIADISGYTRYIAGTEHEHSEEILAELLAVIARSFEGRLRIDQLEGDALCCTTERTDEAALAWVTECFGGFHRRLRDIRAATTCPCRACASVGDLGLKFFIHRGTFSRQEIGTAVQLFGSDVNLVHRLTKNTVPLREYVFATDVTLAGWPDGSRAGFVPLPQHYDLGDVPVCYFDLAPAREAALREAVTRVAPEDARIHLETALDAPIDVAWRLWTDISLRPRWMAADRVEFVPGARGTYLGGEFHCHHGPMAITFRVVGIEPPREMTVTFALPTGVPVAYQTDRLTSLADGRTRWDCWFGWPDPPGPDPDGVSATTIAWLRSSSPARVAAMGAVLADLVAGSPPPSPVA